MQTDGPHVSVLRALSWTNCWIFVPFCLALWTTHDPLTHLAAMPVMHAERQIVCFGNCQVIVATKQGG